METKTCPVCKEKFNKPTTYCSRKCYFLVPKSKETRDKMSAASLGKPKSEHMRLALSDATIGKDKPWLRGTSNPNYGGEYSHDPEVHERFLEAVKKRGQAWTDEHCENHSKLMLGDTNAMRGKNHTEESRKIMSEKQTQRHKNGLAKVKVGKISKPEKEIAEFLEQEEIIFKQQFHITGVPYWYDFYLPDINLVIEYHGDYWHANPNKYMSGSYLKMIGKGLVLVNDIWNRDLLKREAAEQNNYRIVCIWETEYKKFGMEVIKQCLTS